MTYQTTVIKLEGYGAWTLQLGYDREYKLQILQSELYAELQKLFAEKNGLVFSNRFDEYIAITNEIDLREHIEIHKILSQKYSNIDIQMTIGIDKTPLGSNKKAFHVKGKKEYLISPFIYANKDEIEKNKIIENENKGIKIIHLDINNSTEITKSLSPYEITNTIIRLYAHISNIFLKEEGLSFYLGGDNFMTIIRNEISTEEIKKILDNLYQLIEIRFNCGIGNGMTARKAAEMATKSLDKIREYRKNGHIINILEETI